MKKLSDIFQERNLEVPRYTDHTVDVYNADGTFFCTLNNMYEYNKFRVLLVEQQLHQYCYLKFKNDIIHIDRKGTLSKYPDGFYEEHLNDLCKLI